MEIKKLIRENDRVMVVFADDSGTLAIRYFPKTLTNEEIKADICGTPAPAAAPVEEKEPEKAVTIPPPPVVNRQRVSRDQMVAAVTAAKINVDINDPAKLKAAYRNLLTRGRDK